MYNMSVYPIDGRTDERLKKSKFKFLATEHLYLRVHASVVNSKSLKSSQSLEDVLI